METRHWCVELLIVWIGLTCTVAFEEIADITRDNDARTLTTERIAVATTMESYRQSRLIDSQDSQDQEVSGRMAHDHEYQDEEVILDDHHHHHHDEMVDTKAMVEPKNDYWGGYYDFLINEGSYKFWAVFQLATAALLIYSGFAALYYAKVNPMISDDYDDFYVRKRRKRSLDRDKPPAERPYFGFDAQSLQRILDAVAGEVR